MKRVVITGIGVVSPIGNTVEDFWANIKANKHGFGFIDDITSEDFEVKIAARSKDFSCEKYIDKNGAFDISKCDLIAYANGGYYSLDKKIGKFGYSVEKKKKK